MVLSVKQLVLRLIKLGCWEDTHYLQTLAVVHCRPNCPTKATQITNLHCCGQKILLEHSAKQGVSMLKSMPTAGNSPGMWRIGQREVTALLQSAASQITYAYYMSKCWLGIGYLASLQQEEKEQHWLLIQWHCPLGYKAIVCFDEHRPEGW